MAKKYYYEVSLSDVGEVNFVYHFNNLQNRDRFCLWPDLKWNVVHTYFSSALLQSVDNRVLVV